MPQEVEKSTWQSLTIPGFGRGLNKAVDPTLLDSGELLEAYNVRLEKGRVEVDTGYVTFRGVVRGTPQRTCRAQWTGGTSDLFLITTATIYRDVSSQWQYIPDDTPHVTAATAPAAQTYVDVVGANADWSATNYLGVKLNDGTQLQTTIASISAGGGAGGSDRVNLDDAIPAGLSVALAAAVVRPPVLTGTTTIPVDWLIWPPTNLLIFTNGVNAVMRWDGTTCEALEGLAAVNVGTCRSLAIFHNQLFLLYPTESGLELPHRLRRSDTGAADVWTGGNSGTEDLFDRDDKIIKGLPFGPYLIVYRTNSIVRYEYVGAADLLYQPTLAVSGVGPISADSIVDVGEAHFCAMRDNFYLYAGEFSLTPIGDRIVGGVQGLSGLMNPAAVSAATTLWIPELLEAWFMYPSGTASTPNRVLRWHKQTGSWTERAFAGAMISASGFTKAGTTPWSSLVGSWTAQSWTWSSARLLASSPQVLLCAAVGSQVYSYDFLSPTDNGTTVGYTVTTKEFFFPAGQVRIDYAEMLVRGPATQVDYSLDGGNTWTIFGTTTSSTSLAPQRLYKQVITDRIRFRLTGVGDAFKLGWWSIRHRLETVH